MSTSSAPSSGNLLGTMLAAPATALDSKEDKDKDKQMKTLVAALRRRKDDLPEELQALVKEVTVRSGQEETKALHSAVTQHGKAKKEVSEAQAARLQMHAAWRNFLAQSVDQWTKYTAQFVEQEKMLMDRLKLAQENLIAAKESLGSCKSAAGLADKDESSMMSDSEDAVNKDSEALAGQKIAASFKDLASNLQNLHSQAAQAVELEEEQDQQRKRPRTGSMEAPATPSEEHPPHSFGAPE